MAGPKLLPPNGSAFLMGALGALALLTLFRAFPVLNVTRFVPQFGRPVKRVA